MTPAQQRSGRNLDASIADFLRSYGWSQEGRYWTHSRINSEARFTAWDALCETRAKPALGWSVLK